MSTISLDSIIVRSPDQVSTDLGDETVILGLAREEYYSLKEVGARIWEMIQEPKTVRDILSVILRDYDVEPERGEHDLLALLQEMAKEGLIGVKNEDAR